MRPSRRQALVIALAAVAIAVLALYAARRVIAREALLSWLQSHGVAADAQVDAFGPGGFTGRVQVGDPRAPDFVAAHVEIDYGLRGLTFEVRSVTLKAPVLRARIDNGKLSLGSLDPLVQEFLARPVPPDATLPKVVVEQGVLLLTTDYGPVRATGGLTFDDGKLQSLDLVADPARLRSAAFDASLGRSTLTLRTHADRTDAIVDGAVKHLQAGAVAADAARLRLTVNAPYPDLQHHRGDGALTARVNLAGKTLTVAGQSLADAQLSAGFEGQVKGWIEDLAVTGAADANLRASGAGFGDVRSGGLRATAKAADLRWTRKGGDAVAFTPAFTALAQDLKASDLHLAQLSVAGAGPVSLGGQGISADIRAQLGGRGGWTGLGAPVKGDGAQIIAVKRAARGFRFAAPSVAVGYGAAGPRVALLEPLRLRPDTGGEVTVSERAGAPVVGPNGGAVRVAVAGGGLPKLDADIASLKVTPTGAVASGRLQADLSAGPVSGAQLDAAGELRVADGGVTFLASRCVAFQADAATFGVNDIKAISARACPTGQPMATFSQGAWRIRAAAQAVRLKAPFAQVRLEQGSGRIDLTGSARGLNGKVAITSARLADEAPQARFNPLVLAGQLDIAGDRLAGGVDARSPAGVALAHGDLSHNLASGAGQLAFDTGELKFTPSGLQPVQLSPLAAAIGSPAEGSARFSGRFGWSADGITSSGQLEVPRLDFQSPAGRVTGLSGKVVFTSLAPLIAAPGQELRADSIAALQTLNQVSATFGLSGEGLVISGGGADVGGGKLIIESLTLPLTPGGAVKGVLAFQGVQLHDLVEASPFAGHVELDARVTGRVPFETEGGKIRVLGGDLHAIQPGRLSIKREALSAVDGEGGPAVPVAEAQATDTFSDFAYQAMENLAFDKLDAAVSSRSNGRLGVIFHIVGKHDPPVRQQIKLSIIDLIQKKFLNRKLPLPSGTGVDLTLDTTLNLDDLLADYAAYQKLRSSRGVQP